MTQMKIEEVCIGYSGHIIMEDISFEVSSGDYLCIVGENGSGKTTLMKSMLGLIPIIHGEIVLGEDFKRNEIGYLPQHREIQKDFPASVYEIVVSGFLNRCGLRPFYNKTERELAFESMKKVGIENIAKSCYRELSGGQQQRVLLARALCASSKMLLLDEPVAGLDPEATKDMYELIKRLNKDDGITVIMISHDVNAATKYATHILKLGDSKWKFEVKK